MEYILAIFIVTAIANCLLTFHFKRAVKVYHILPPFSIVVFTGYIFALLLEAIKECINVLKEVRNKFYE